MNKISYSVVAKSISPSMLGIYIRCEQFGKSIDVDTSVHIFNGEWNENNEMVVDNPNAKKLNRYIRKTLYDLEGIELDYDGSFTLAKLEDVWTGQGATHDFYEVMAYQIMHRDIRESTQEIHKRVLVHLKTYQAECSISDLTEDFVKGFIRYMKGIGLNSTTQGMHVRTFRCYYHIAQKLYGSKVPADSFAFYHETAEQRYDYKLKALSDDDIRMIENYISLPDTDKKYILALERFLFMAYTGVRISDFAAITKDSITIEDGKMWLSYTSIKTDTPARIPLSYIFDGRAEQLISKHRDDLDAFFQLNKKTYNGQLKTACKHAGIKKNVSAHTARHTCATRLVNKDVPVTTIQKLIGHRTLKMTMVYAKINETTLVRQLSK